MFEKNYRLQDIQLSKSSVHLRARRYGGQPSPAITWLGLPTVARRRVKLRRAKVGGEYRARTGDLLVANQALSQLS